MKIYDESTAYDGNDAKLIPEKYYAKDKNGELKEELSRLKEVYEDGDLDEDDYDNFKDFLVDFFESSTGISYTKGYNVFMGINTGTRKNNRILDIFIYNRKYADPSVKGFSYNMSPFSYKDMEQLEKQGLIYRVVKVFTIKSLTVNTILKLFSKINYHIKNKHSVISYYYYS